MRTDKWLWAAASAAGLALASPAVFAAGGGHSGGHAGGWSGGHGAGIHGGGGHWSGGHVGGGHWGGGHWGGGPRYYGGVGLYFGLPLFWGPWWDPYYYPSYYYPAPVVYREYVAPPPAADDGQATLLPGGNAARPVASYCASARAYYPEVKACPEGWQISSPAQ